MAKTFRITSTSVTSRPVKQRVIHKSPHVTTVTTEVSTQTDRDNYVIGGLVTSHDVKEYEVEGRAVDGTLGERVISSLSLSRQQPKSKAEKEAEAARKTHAKDPKYDFETESRDGGD